MGIAGAVVAIVGTTLGITYNGGGGGMQGCHTAAGLYGCNTPHFLPIITVSPTAADFGSQDLAAGATVAQVLTVRNSGGVSASISSITLGGANANQFGLSANTCSSTLAANASCTVNVNFDPTTVGGKAATLQVADNANGSPQVGSLSGIGIVVPVALVAPSSADYGSQDIAAGATATQVLSLTNTGSGVMTISGVALAGTDAGQFSLSANTCGATLAAGASCTASVAFDPSTAGSKTAIFQVIDNAAGSPHVSLLTGNGTTGVVTAGTANVWLQASGGNDTSGNCVRFSSPIAAPVGAVCATMTKAIALALPGDVIELEPGTYSSLTISRQSGSDSPKVIVRGDPNMPDQFGCAADTCAEGNVVVNSLTVCGHGLQIQDFDSNARDQSYEYVGDSTCPTPTGNIITSNHDIELDNVHFTEGTVRGTNLTASHSRWGPEYDICGSPAARSDLLHIWPDGNGHMPVNVVIDHSVLWWNEMDIASCGAAHADNVQMLGVNGLTFTNNIIGGEADDLWTDGSLNGTTENGAILIANNFFNSVDTGPVNGVGVQFGLNQDGAAICNANYTIINNTFAGGKNITLKCTSGTHTWTNNFLHMSANQASTCGSGAFDYNAFDATSVVCGTHTKQCAPTFQFAGAVSADFTHGWDDHISTLDACLRGSGSPTTFQLTDIDGQTRPQGSATDIGADEVP